MSLARCNCPQRLTCLADEWAHRLGLRIGWLCDRHDFNITGVRS